VVLAPVAFIAIRSAEPYTRRRHVARLWVGAGSLQVSRMDDGIPRTFIRRLGIDRAYAEPARALPEAGWIGLGALPGEVRNLTPSGYL